MTTTLNHVEMKMGANSRARRRDGTAEPVMVTHRHFETYGDFVSRVLDADAAGEKGWGKSSSETDSGDKDWTLGVDYEGSKTLAVDGWPEGREMMVGKMSDALNAHPLPDVRTEWTNDNWGFILDVGAYLAGDERCALRPAERPELNHNIVKLRVSLACSSGVTGQEKANWGTAVVFLIQKLEAAGKSVQLEACYFTVGHTGSKCKIHDKSARGRTENVGTRYLTTITLKRAGEPLDLDRVAYVIAHPAAHRRLIFRTRELEQSLGKRDDGTPCYAGYGSPDIMPDVSEPNTVNIEGVQFNRKHAANIDKAISKVTEIFNAQVDELDNVEA